tara:strand:+ start:57 stop:365 length:309 start_codon:yes stop_codon:yes gene_type:complete
MKTIIPFSKVQADYGNVFNFDCIEDGKGGYITTPVAPQTDHTKNGTIEDAEIAYLGTKKQIKVYVLKGKHDGIFYKNFNDKFELVYQYQQELNLTIAGFIPV